MEQTTAEVQSQPDVGGVSPDNSISSSAPAPVHAEKMVPQSKVDEIVRHANANVAQKARQEALAEYERNRAANAPIPSSNTNNSAPDFQSLVAQQVQQQLGEIRQAAFAEQQGQLGQKLANDFNSRLDATKDSYSDFDDVVKDFPFGAFPNSVFKSLDFDNTGDIMYELAGNPTKIQMLETLAVKDLENSQKGIPSNLAHREMKRISDALKINKNASNVKTPNAPLSQLKPSPAGTDNGSRSVSDFRELFKKRNR